MIDRTIKCIVSRYDDTIKEPPFKTIPIDTIEIQDTDPIVDKGGETRYLRLVQACKAKGHTLKFYTLSEEKGMTYDVVVK
tara:strand:+ start:1054 stop:1293 length:240 start_codon:yes stop_codon:yes gene_type:complete